MGWVAYARAVLVFSFVSTLALYALQRLQGCLPLNPAGMTAVRPDLAFNTAVSFVTNTNWQSYSPELDHELPHADERPGRAELRLGRRRHGGRGRAWCAASAAPRAAASATSGPTSCAARSTCCCRSRSSSASCCWRAAPSQTFDGPGPRADALRRHADHRARPVRRARRRSRSSARTAAARSTPTASHPYENPTPFTNLLEIWSLLLIPFAMPFLFGRMVGRMREGVALLAAMLLLLGTGLRHLAGRRDAHHARADRGRPHARGQHGGQGAALHDPGGVDLQRRDDRHVDRRRQLDARLLHGHRRAPCR